MSRRSNTSLRCPRCRLHGTLCVCALVPRLETRTRVVLIIHRFEDRKPTNTGRIATDCLVNSEVMVRGDRAAAAEPFACPPGTLPLVLFPYEHALPLSDFAGSSEPVTLVVPDGNWRQASKVKKRVPGLSDVPCVSLPEGPPSQYRLRTEATLHGLSTLEAIARALGILEGEHVQRELERVLTTMVERTLWARGTLATAEATQGIPEGVMRHDPGGHRSAPRR